MPDGSTLSALAAPAVPQQQRFRARWVSPLLRRILLVNALPLALLVAALLYLDQYQNGLLEAEVSALREQARIYAGALGESAVRTTEPDNPKLAPDIARPLLRRLTEPTPGAQAKLYAPDGTVIADSRVREGPSGAVSTEPLPPAVERGPIVGAIGWVYDKVLTLLPHETPTPLVVDMTPGAGGLEWQPDVKEELRLNSSGQSREMPPYIRRTKDNRLLVTVAEPVERDRHTVGIILLTRDAREVETSLFVVRISILALFGLALALTVLLSWYLSLTIARPILRLAGAAAEMREGHGRAGGVPAPLLARRDEVGRAGHGAVGFGAGAVRAHGRDREIRRRRGARDQEPAVVDPQRDRDAAAHRGSGAAEAVADHHRAGRDAAGPADQRCQRCVAAGRGAVAHDRRTGRRGADPATRCANSTRRRATPRTIRGW